MNSLAEVAPRFTAAPERIVCLGGGHGLAATLQAVRILGHVPVGVVSVADDGGSSGRLREHYRHIPPGDLRRCVGALVPEDSPWAQLLEYRFVGGELDGHALGNLLFSAVCASVRNATEAAVALASLVGAEGLVLPAGNEPLTLSGRAAEDEVAGQVRVAQTPGISDIAIDPSDPAVDGLVIEAVGAATTITFGPGSLFTSVLAVCKVPAIAKAIEASRARKILVANLASGAGEAQGLSISRHVELLAEAGVSIDVVLFDDNAIEAGLPPASETWVRGELARPDGRTHDTSLLAKALSSLLG